MAALGERALDGFGHFVLARAVLEWEWRAGEDSTGREKLVERGQCAS
jgi:hypothetical protein